MLRGESCASRPHGSMPLHEAPVRSHTPSSRVRPHKLPGEFATQTGLRGWVLLVYGHEVEPDCSHHRNQYEKVARALMRHRLATLPLALPSTPGPDHGRDERDIDALGEHVLRAMAWLGRTDALSARPCSLWGIGGGSAPALVAAATQPGGVAALVTSGGRPDLAWPRLSLVQAPTLVIVAGDDVLSQAVHRSAWLSLRCEKRYEVIPGVVDLFDTPDAWDSAIALAAQWLGGHVRSDLSR
jgi:putative phosphoribosyl transferase